MTPTALVMVMVFIASNISPTLGYGVLGPDVIAHNEKEPDEFPRLPDGTSNSRGTREHPGQNYSHVENEITDRDVGALEGGGVANPAGASVEGRRSHGADNPLGFPRPPSTSPSPQAIDRMSLLMSVGVTTRPPIATGTGAAQGLTRREVTEALDLLTRLQQVLSSERPSDIPLQDPTPPVTPNGPAVSPPGPSPPLAGYPGYPTPVRYPPSGGPLPLPPLRCPGGGSTSTSTSTGPGTAAAAAAAASGCGGSVSTSVAGSPQGAEVSAPAPPVGPPATLPSSSPQHQDLLVTVLNSLLDFLNRTKPQVQDANSTRRRPASPASLRPERLQSPGMNVSFPGRPPPTPARPSEASSTRPVTNSGSSRFNVSANIYIPILSEILRGTTTTRTTTVPGAVAVASELQSRPSDLQVVRVPTTPEDTADRTIFELIQQGYTLG